MAEAASSTTEKKFLTLKSSYGDEFELEESIAIQCVTIKNMVEEDCSSSVIPLTNINTETLIKIIEYPKMHSLTSSNEEEVENFDKDQPHFEDSVSDTYNERNDATPVYNKQYPRHVWGTTPDDAEEEHVVDAKERVLLPVVPDEWAAEAFTKGLNMRISDASRKPK
nr:SKP1-like protein 4 [Nicotiana tomentosiformis]